MPRPIRLLIVDDHDLVRESLAMALAEEDGMEILESAPDAAVALKLAEEHRPDVIVMDIDMPGLNCFDAARQLRDLIPESKILFLSAYFHDHYIEQALAVRARGYLTKHDSRAVLVDAIRRVVRDELYFSDRIWSRLVVGIDGLKLAANAKSRASMLTIREVEILRYVARGMSKKKIAAILQLSPKTVEVHTFNLMNKIQIHDRVELARYAIREGLVEV